MTKHFTFRAGCTRGYVVTQCDNCEAFWQLKGSLIQ